MDDDDVHLYCYSKTRRFMAFPKKLDGLAVKKSGRVDSANFVGALGVRP